MLLTAPLLAPLLPFVPIDDETLLDARKGFETTRVENDYEADGPAPAPPDGYDIELVRYESPAGQLVAYSTAEPSGSRKHAVVIWAHGGFGGIGRWLWRDGGIFDTFSSPRVAVFCPSWRGENDNPGDFELFYGELDDLLAAIDHVAALDWVDPERIYVAGHSTGGTMAMLAALSSDKVRAAFSIGGAPDVCSVVQDGWGYGNTPFDYEDDQECQLRSATRFVGTLKTPTFYFEGEASSYPEEALAMEAKAKEAGAPFDAFVIERGNHFDILSSVTELIAEKIFEDVYSKTKTWKVRITDRDVERAFGEWRATQREADDLEALAAMRREGQAIDKEGVMMFNLMTYELGDALEGLTKAIDAAGMKVLSNDAYEDEYGDPYAWIVCSRKVEFQELAKVFAASEDADDLAHEHGAVYQGWSGIGGL